MSTSGRAYDGALVISGLELPAIPSLNEICEHFSRRVRGQVREEHSLLFFQPSRKLIVLREVIVFRYLVEFVCLEKKEKKIRVFRKLKIQAAR